MKLILVFVSLLAAVSANSKRWSSSFGSSFGSYRPSSSFGSQSYRPSSSFGSQSSSGSSGSSSSGTCGKPSVTSPFVNGGVIKESGFQGIVGGKKAAPGMYPYQVRVHTMSPTNPMAYGQCGGSIISKNWVLTAAHCFEDSTPARSIKVYVGAFDTSRGDYGKECNVVKTVRHQYRNRDKENDIALLQIDCGSGFDFSDKVQPVCLPSSSDDLRTRTGTQVIITGWGTIYSDGPTSDVMQHTVVAVSDIKECERKYTGGSSRPGWLCAAARGRDTCQGDSGGPLVYMENGKFVQYGVVSFGRGCASPGYPGVYTHVPYYRDWIKEKTGV